MVDARIQGVEESVAVIGMACRFPGARNLEEFWNNLVQGVESICFFSQEELLETGIEEDKLKQPGYVRARGTPGDVVNFDAHFFGFTPREAEIMDPQHRIFLECAWHALEDGGYDPGRDKARIGVFGGAGVTHHLFQLYQNPEVQQYASGISIVTGNDKDYLTTRVSYKLNLRGPSVNVQSACSTSLVAALLGMYSLLSYQCDMVLAGGVSIDLPEIKGYVYQQGGLDSPDGHCRAFDARARGTVFSRGAGVVLLKRLSEALRDGDHIYAVIKGGAINNDGDLKAGFTAPGVEGQVEVAVEALTMAGITPDSLSYFETHGTGTQIGDPIEIAALTKAFRYYTDKKQFCALGSVKTNIGHTDIAAGAAGLIKTALALKYGKLPPTLHFENPNPGIDLENSPFYVNTRLMEWQTDDGPRIAGVSSFGVGGTNASVILEEAPPVSSSPSLRPYKVFVLSARTEPALQTMTRGLKEHIETHPGIDLADAAYSLQIGRKLFEHRRFFLGREWDDLLAGLGDPASPKIFTAQGKESNRPVVFMFPGQGSQYVNMGLALYRSESVFREQVDTCCQLLKPQLGFDLREVFYPAPEAVERAEPRLNQTIIAQPALFVMEYALAQLWLSWGVSPTAMIGHSVGEYAAACLAGVFSLEDALKAVAARGKLVQEMPEGSMIAVLLPEKDIAALMEPPLAIAAVNSPGMTVVSGPTPNILKFAEFLKEKRIHSKSLATSHAFHSAMMDPMLESFARVFTHISLQATTIPFISTVTGTWITEKEARDPDYWVRHVRQTVRFADGITELLKAGEQVFLEVGPGRSLESAVKRNVDASQFPIISSMRAANDNHTDTEHLATALGHLWAAGAHIAWSQYYRGEQRRRIPMPGYPFQREQYAADVSHRYLNNRLKPDQSNKKKKTDVGQWFYLPSWTRTVPPGLLPREPTGEQGARWMVLIDDQGFGSEIINRLQQQDQEVIRIEKGSSFRQSHDGHFTIDPGDRSHYDLLFENLKNEKTIPTRIIHLWNITSPQEQSVNQDKIAGSEKLSFYSPLFMEQALIKQNILDNLHLVVVTNGMFDIGGEAVQCPEKALVLGPCRVFRQEFPMAWCRAVDVGLPAVGPERKALAEILIRETTLCTEDTVVAYRGGHRWTQVFEPVYLESPQHHNSLLQDKGVYLITGGLGGMGLAVARFLLETIQARLILVYRSPLPPADQWQEWLDTHGKEDPVSAKIRGIESLQKAGTDMLLCQADVSDFEAMGQVVEQARKKFGTINGVFHSAGMAGGGVIPLKTTDMAARVLAPKVKGTLVLEAVLADMKPDFFILFSSITAVLGEAGRVDYCSANAFLDAFANSRNSKGNGLTTSLNWATWGMVGMAVRSRTASSVLAMEGENAVETGPGPLLRSIIHRNNEEIYQVHLDPQQDWVISDHRLFGSPTLVGTAYLEMACQVARMKSSHDAVILQNVYFMAPFMVSPQEQRLLRLFTTETRGICRFAFKSHPRGGIGREAPWQDHAMGEIDLTAVPQPPRHDLNRLMGQCQDNIVRPSFSSLVGGDHQPAVLEFGPRWECVVQVYIGQREWLACLELAEEFHGDLEHHPLHPAMVDMATSFCLHYVTEAFYLPLGYKKMVIHRPLTTKIYAYARYRGDPGEAAEKEIAAFDFVIMDPQGNELLNIESYTLKRIPETLLAHPGDARDSLVIGQSDAAASSSPPDSGGKMGDANDILPQEGIEALRRVLGVEALPQLVICTRDFPSMIEENSPSAKPGENEETARTAAAKPAHSRPSIATPYVEPGNEVEKTVAEVWQSILGINKIGIHDNFTELGGNSLLAIQAVANTADSFQVDLSVETFYRNPTVAGIAKAIVAQLSALADEDTLEQILAEIEQMPGE